LTHFVSIALQSWKNITLRESISFAMHNIYLKHILLKSMADIQSRVRVSTRRGMDWMIGFIGHLTQSTRNYKWVRAIAELHTLQFTVTNTLRFSVFTSCILATVFNVVVIPVYCKCSTHEVFFAQPNSFIAISSQSSSTTCHLYWPKVKVKIKVTLRLAVYSQSVRLGVKPLKTRYKIFFFRLNSCGNSPYVTSSLTRRWVCLLWIRSAFLQEYISHIEHGTENSSFCTIHKSSVSTGFTEQIMPILHILGYDGSLLLVTESESYVTTDGQPDSLATQSQSQSQSQS
jgi:hypothetical protein